MKIWSLVVVTGVLLFVGNAYASVVPEIDGGSAVSAIGVLIGVAALLAERLRRRR